MISVAGPDTATALGEARGRRASADGPGAKLERLEVKYLIDERLASRIAAYVAGCCVPDPHNPREPGTGYPINTLYLDSPTRALYRAKVRREPDRFKLRVRTYSEHGPVNFEVKRKRLDVIEKARVAVARELAARAAIGLAPPLEAAHARILSSFAALVTLTGASPAILVRYEREAYVSTVDHYARVTFDRKIVAQRVDGWELVGARSAWLSLAGGWLRAGHCSPVLLELKSETVRPVWMVELVRRFELGARAFSKYCRGLEVAEGFARGFDPSPGPRGEPD